MSRRQNGHDEQYAHIEPGKQIIRVQASSVNGQPLVIVLRSAHGAQERTISDDSPIAEFRMEAARQPAEVSLKDWGVLRWITAMPQAAIARQGARE